MYVNSTIGEGERSLTLSCEMDCQFTRPFTVGIISATYHETVLDNHGGESESVNTVSIAVILKSC